MWVESDQSLMPWLSPVGPFWEAVYDSWNFDIDFDCRELLCGHKSGCMIYAFCLVIWTVGVLVRLFFWLCFVFAIFALLIGSWLVVMALWIIWILWLLIFTCLIAMIVFILFCLEGFFMALVGLPAYVCCFVWPSCTVAPWDIDFGVRENNLNLWGMDLISLGTTLGCYVYLCAINC